MILEAGVRVYSANKAPCKVDRLIGRGAFGGLYRIVSEEDRRVYALKTLTTLHDDELDVLVNEGRMGPLVDHPNVIRVWYFHDGCEHPGLPPYLVMDYADGGSLQDILDKQRGTGAQFGMERLRRMLVQLAGGMRAVNEVLIHGDIKPDNILVADGTLKISDFGLSKIIGSARRAGSFGGQHIRYMAPEAWEHRGGAIQADMYSMGIVFYELATLRHPYEVSLEGQPITSWREAHLHAPVVSPETINPELPPGIARVINRMLAKHPEDRYAAWSEIAVCLEPG